MPYFTVVAKDFKTGHTKTYTGVKAPTGHSAVMQVSSNGNKNMHYDVWMSKRHRRDNRVSNWTRGRELHEHREQGRSYWAALARKGRRSFRRFIDADPTMFYRTVMQRCTESWRGTTALFGPSRQRAFSSKHLDVPND